jgi:hypothetical protein
MIYFAKFSKLKASMNLILSDSKMRGTALEEKSTIEGVQMI